MSPEQEFTEAEYLKSRGLHRAQVVADLNACRKAWQTWGKLASALDVGSSTLQNSVTEQTPFSSKMIIKIYGLRGSQMIVRGPDSRPIPTRDVPEGQAQRVPVEHDDEALESGVARILQACKPAQTHNQEQQLSTASPLPAEAPAVLPASAPTEAAGSEEEAGDGEGSPASESSLEEITQSQTSVPGEREESRAATTEEAATASVMGAAADLEPGSDVGAISKDTSGPGSGADVTHEEPSGDAVAATVPAEALTARDPNVAATDVDRSQAADVTHSVAPWSSLEDRDFTALLEGKLAELGAEMLAIEEREAALLAQREVLNLAAIRNVQRQNALRALLKSYEEGKQDAESAEAGAATWGGRGSGDEAGQGEGAEVAAGAH